ncbi:Threonyl and Alanyl tRNA synthetase second additional domain [Trypanosoma vivax]|uniref:Threonyl/alanyl tRNA synthetase SAD domain-containing protein n=1 Tax=Trypanosoma vivax (strain Y486) TaxID=1055687 RepID=G0U2C6_TRYVY|nr:hypothetical protein TRVL_07139 [Trypanosoma vivax]KAH8611677.1 Threonyl and Alanyl tRNA synthetase second additional domain [Trypanosoma vivax]CCC50429.1 conserved hypothetical protein [Trypanosoma vivax Y486]
MRIAHVGELACQRNPFLRELTVHVVSCTAATVADSRCAGDSGEKVKAGNGGNKVAAQPVYNVVLTDSILFPDGGGQPCDHGVLVRRRERGTGTYDEGVVEEFPVRQVQRKGDTCVLKLSSPLVAGEEVCLRVDWPRRVDHMQHHSAQHLLSAIVDDPLFCGLPTISWALAHPYCHIVLPTGKKLEAEVLQRIEDACNDAIARAVPVSCEVYSGLEAYNAHVRAEEEKGEKEPPIGEAPREKPGIPADMTGPIRMITISGIDSCPCCGTHVTNLAQLQMVKLLHQETKGDTLKLFFIAGDRVRRYFGDMYGRERELMKEMGGVRPEDFVSAAVRRGRDFASLEKRLKNMALELTKLEGEKLVVRAKELVGRQGEAGTAASGNTGKVSNELNGHPVVTYRRDDVDVDFFTGLKEALEKSCPQCLGVFAWAVKTGGESKCAKTGQFMVVGPTDGVEALAAKVCSVLSGRGGMSRLGYRGKGDLTNWEVLVRELDRFNRELEGDE